MTFPLLTAKQLKIFLLTTASVGLSLPSQAATLDLSSWDSTGDVSSSISQVSISNHALQNDDFPSVNGLHNFSGNAAVDSFSLTNFLGINNFALDGLDLFDDAAIEGSAIQQTITIKANERLVFDWTFLTNEDPLTAAGAFGTIGDYAFIVIDGIVTPLFEVVADGNQLTNSASNYISEANGTFTTSFFTSEQNVTFGIGIVDIGDGTISSGLTIQNVKTEPVPEPLTILGTVTALIIGSIKKMKIANSVVYDKKNLN